MACATAFLFLAVASPPDVCGVAGGTSASSDTLPGLTGLRSRCRTPLSCRAFQKWRRRPALGVCRDGCAAGRDVGSGGLEVDCREDQPVDQPALRLIPASPPMRVRNLLRPFQRRCAAAAAAVDGPALGLLLH